MEDNIKVVLRTRPLNKRETAANCGNLVQSNESDPEHSVILACKPESKQFSFDSSFGQDSTQEQVFRDVGIPLTESCLQGFNGTIIAYGQTGSGKTHTLFGHTNSPVSASALAVDSGTGTDVDRSRDRESDQRGLVPRVFEYLWQKIAMAEALSEVDVEADATATITSYSCKCSFYEIYNEKVLDLLDTGSGSSGNGGGGLSIREDQKKGVYVDGITEEVVSSPADATKILALGYRNRHVSSTAMNRDSSRSHAVFLLTVTVTTTNQDKGLKMTNSATFSLVDLAGSERQKATQSEGMRLKEASKINQSLSTLGSVIHALSVGGPNHSKFVRYRDSALTFLLRDSLGGNSKTVLIAAISPSSDAMSETLGTLKFAQRAKTVRNVVSANVFAHGNVEALQKEIRELRSQLSNGFGSVSTGVGIGGMGFTLEDCKLLQDKNTQLTAIVEEREAANDHLRIQVLELQQAQAQTQVNAQVRSQGGGKSHTSTITPTTSEQEQLQQYRDRAGMLSCDLHIWHSTAFTSRHNNTQLQTRLLDSSVKCAQSEEACRVAEEHVRAIQSKTLQCTRDLQNALFERDQAVERADTLETQCTSLSADLEELQQRNAAAVLELKTLYRNSDSGGSKTNGQMALLEKEAELSLLHSNLLQETTLRENTECKAQSTMDDLLLSRQVISEISTKLQVQSQVARERLLQVEESAAVVADMLLAREQNEIERKELQEQVISLQAQLQVERERESTSGGKLLPVLSSNTVSPSTLATVAGTGTATCITSAAATTTTDRESAIIISELRAELLALLQKQEQSSQVRSNLIACQSELQSLKQLYANSKTATDEAEQRASATMSQLIELSKNLSNGVSGASSSSSSHQNDYENEYGNSNSKSSTRNTPSGGAVPSADKLERDLKKAVAERDASREVLAEVESEMDTCKRRLVSVEQALQEVRMENTRLRESQHSNSTVSKAMEKESKKEKEFLSFLQANMKEKEAKIAQLREQRDQLRGEVAALSKKVKDNKDKEKDKDISTNMAQLIDTVPPSSVSVRSRGSGYVPKIASHLDKDVDAENHMPPPPGSVSMRRRGGLSHRNGGSSGMGMGKENEPYL